MAVAAVGGKADTGLGERDEEEEDEEEDIGQSREFMSWRLRQKAVTCSVLCGQRVKGRKTFVTFRATCKHQSFEMSKEEKNNTAGVSHSFLMFI